jgi:hypothetical protein
LFTKFNVSAALPKEEMIDVRTALNPMCETANVNTHSANA